MKLYFRPGACSLSPHIVARELGLELEIVRVEKSTNLTADGRSYLEINPLGYVPALVLDDGEILLEGPAIVQHLAGLSTSGGLSAGSSREHRRSQSLLNFIATEIHKPMVLMFEPEFAPVKELLREMLDGRLDRLASGMSGDFLAADRLGLADIYLFVCLNWAPWIDVDLSRNPKLLALMERVASRPAVLSAFEAEGLERLGDGPFFAPRRAG